MRDAAPSRIYASRQRNQTLLLVPAPAVGATSVLATLADLEHTAEPKKFKRPLSVTLHVTAGTRSDLDHSLPIKLDGYKYLPVNFNFSGTNLLRGLLDRLGCHHRRPDDGRSKAISMSFAGRAPEIPANVANGVGLASQPRGAGGA
jgi:hypothetical protein